MTADLVDDRVLVLRIVRRIKEFIPAGAVRPIGSAFRPNSGDEKDAEERKHPVRVSVWDWERTTVAQALAFRAGGTRGPDELEPGVFSVQVGEISEIARKHDSPKVRVVYEALEGEDASKPGADGHSGIEGLHESDGAKKVVKAIRADIADKCDPVHDRGEVLALRASAK